MIKPLLWPHIEFFSGVQESRHFSRFSNNLSLNHLFILYLHIISFFGITSILQNYCFQGWQTHSILVEICLLHPQSWMLIKLGTEFSVCYSHASRETNSLRRTMQRVECSLLHQRAQGRVSSWPRTPTSICENLLYPMCTCPNPPPQIPWDLRKQRKGTYKHNNPIIHVLCVQRVNNQ